MSISLLSNQTVRLLGSSQHAPTPESVIKELLDNAIDAGGTSVEVSASANFLDYLQVRDNGHGVANADRSMLCKANATSKLTHLYDLKTIGPRSLGFRGTALAGILATSGSLHITTRISGEPTASLIKFSHSLSLQRESIAAPVGTTVRAIDLFKPVPVRRQTYQKCAAKTQAKVKQLLREYALACPHVRLSLHVHKPGCPRQDMILASSPANNLEEAARKVLGRDCVNQCANLTAEKDGFKLLALLPKADACSAPINGHGAFVAVDARPISTARGLMHTLVRRFREQLSAASPDRAHLQNPFGMLQFSCPPGAYDVNIEPMKDDVLFENSTIVTDLLNQVLSNCYGQHNNDHLQESGPAPATVGSEHAKQAEREGNGTTRGQSIMEQDLGTDNGIAGIEHSNPWIVAKMNTLHRQRLAHQRHASHSPLPVRRLPIRSYPQIEDIESVSGAQESSHSRVSPPSRPALRNIDVSDARSSQGTDSMTQDTVHSSQEYDIQTARTKGHTYPVSRKRSPTPESEARVGLGESPNPSETVSERPPKRTFNMTAALHPAKKPRLGNSGRTGGMAVHVQGSGVGRGTGAQAPFKRPHFITKKERTPDLRPDPSVIVSDDEDDLGSLSHASRSSTRSRLVPGAITSDGAILSAQAPPAADTSARISHLAPGAASVLGRAIEALGVSLEGIKECCRVLKETRISAEAYPDVPMERPVSHLSPCQDYVSDSEEDGCATPETLRPSSLSTLSDEEMEPWRQQLLDYLNGMDSAAVPTA